MEKWKKNLTDIHIELYKIDIFLFNKNKFCFNHFNMDNKKCTEF